ncbi:MAG: hypothetical protein Q8K63_13430 [Acidimicrobiales bacterium]|nr:hypothetical protein [Acidimicrobiales bacterium]
MTMQRSAQQVMYTYLPDAVFAHEDGFLAQVHHVIGERVADINKQVLLEQLDLELLRWTPDQIGIPSPRMNPDEFVVLRPIGVNWDVYPLTFECTNQKCRRVRRWSQQQGVIADTDAAGAIKCLKCKSKMRQLRYLAAHNCGAMTPMHVPSCQNCPTGDDMYLDDVGSFVSSQWKCRTCGHAQATRFFPCACGQYQNANGTSFMRGFTARDGRLFNPQSLTLINIANQTYDNFQRLNAADRAAVALASWLGDEPVLARSLNELVTSTGTTRKTAAQWATQEEALRASGVDEDVIANLKSMNGPLEAGAAALRALVSTELLEAFEHGAAAERAGLFDTTIVADRKSFADLRAAAPAAGPERVTVDLAHNEMRRHGIADVSVTQQFPIVIASYGYSRVRREPGAAHLRSYARQKFYGNKTPIFAVPANTEAFLVSFDAQSILGFLIAEGDYTGSVPAIERDAKLVIGEMLATDDSWGTDTPAAKVRRLVHSASHALLRALDDGQSGFGESSLAEWTAIDTLTVAIYVSSYAEFTLGAFDSVLRRRLGNWLQRTGSEIDTCDNDPMCSHTSPKRPHAACDRCLHLSFGCRNWNADLDRKLLRRFWQHTALAALAPTP